MPGLPGLAGQRKLPRCQGCEGCPDCEGCQDFERRQAAGTSKIKTHRRATKVQSAPKANTHTHTPQALRPHHFRLQAVISRARTVYPACYIVRPFSAATDLLYCTSCLAVYCVLYCIVLYCIVSFLYCIPLYSIVVDCIVLHLLYCIRFVLYCIALHCIALHCMCIAWYCMCIAWYFIVLHCIALRCIVLHFIASYRILSGPAECEKRFNQLACGRKLVCSGRGTETCGRER